MTATVNYTGAFNITDASSGVFNCIEGLQYGFPSAYGARFTGLTSVANANFCDIHSLTDVDLYGRYSFTKQFSVHASILNLFNRDPPLDLQTYGGGGELAYGTAFGGQAGAVGRFFTVGATYKF